MTTTARTILIVISVIQLLFALGFSLQLPLVTTLWSFPGTTPLTFIFVGSIFAAAGATTLWVALSGHWGALVGIALDYIMIMVPISFYSWQVGTSTNNTGITMFAVATGAGAIMGVVMLLWSRRFPLDKSVPTPPLVLWSFAVFIGALLIVSFQLIRQTPNVLPWGVTPEISVLCGWMFFGAAIYFIYALLRPTWANAAGQLMGFLAYDIVLIIPFLNRLPTVAPEFRVALWAYIAVVSYSGILAFYYLFVKPMTRIVKPGPIPAISQ